MVRWCVCRCFGVVRPHQLHGRSFFFLYVNNFFTRFIYIEQRWSTPVFSSRTNVARVLGVLGAAWPRLSRQQQNRLDT